MVGGIVVLAFTTIGSRYGSYRECMAHEMKGRPHTMSMVIAHLCLEKFPAAGRPQ